MFEEIRSLLQKNSSLILRLESDERTLGEDIIFHGTVVSDEDSENLRKKYCEVQKMYSEVALILEGIDAIYRKYIVQESSTR